MRQTEIVRTPIDTWIAGKLGIGLTDLTQNALEIWQMEAFRRTLRYAKAHSRFYREQMANIDPDTLRSLADIRALPLTSESDLIENEWRFQCVNLAEVSRVVTVSTTGTTGKSKRIAFTVQDQQITREFMVFGFLTMCERNDRMLVMMSGGTPGSIGDNVDKAMQHLNVTTQVHGPVTDIAEAYRHIMEFQPNVVVGIPCQTAALARYGQRFGNPERAFIKSVLLSADDVPEAICTRVSTCWDCNVFRHYGMTEMCITGGDECLGRDGYHLRACDLLFEIIDEDEEGFGEIVLTTLDREAMPLIRYRTGDIGRFTHSACPCGSPLRRIEQIRGRKHNCVEINGKTVYLIDVLDQIFSLPEAVDCTCEVQKDGGFSIVIGVLPGERVDIGKLRIDATVTVKEMSAFDGVRNCKKRMVFV